MDFDVDIFVREIMAETNQKQKNLRGKAIHTFYLKGDEVPYGDAVRESLIIALNKGYPNEYKLEYSGLVLDGSFLVRFSIYPSLA